MWSIEVTDTFGGESNFSWVRRGVTRANTPRAIREAVKNLAGWNCRVFMQDFGDTIEFRPAENAGICEVAFATWKD